MASQTVMSTPNKSAPVPPPAPTPPPGTWEHPRLAEISQRRVRDEFDERKLKIILISAAAFVLSFYLPTTRPMIYITLLNSTVHTLCTALLYFTRLSIAYKVYTALRPLLHRRDDMSDIALTPSQRALLGLGPASAPATPGSTYITPPRYLRSSSRNHSAGGGSSRAATVGSSGGSRAAAAAGGGIDTRSVGSSGFGTPVFGKSTAGVFDSPLAGSPLARKAMGQRASLGLGASVGGEPGTPSPVALKNTGVGLSNKFLYQRRVASNGGMSGFI